ncbi:hypothetical protein L1987_36575 [Smallanthus sonchifolius]|uniref:Uncharacterized protein n=1 Tax=Smallanthus sonchifolius TaxID=185202 RepID=A0ACB9HEE9_9ASTR|nr:hypothetical protein L1987_36575 [Smallanthus sonchifolius]
MVKTKSRSDPLVAYLGVQIDTVSVTGNANSNTSSFSNFNGSQVLHQTVYNRTRSRAGASAMQQSVDPWEPYVQHYEP